MVELRREKTQIVNMHSSRDAWVVGLAARLAGVSLVLRTRHIDVIDRSPRISKHKLTLQADLELTTSQKITDRIRNTYHLPKNRVSTLPTGILLNLFAPLGPRLNCPCAANLAQNMVWGTVHSLPVIARTLRTFCVRAMCSAFLRSNMKVCRKSACRRSPAPPRSRQRIRWHSGNHP
jgi:hypothetical protein